MKVKFKGNTEPCIVYEVKNATHVVEYDEVQQRYCECIEVELLGLVDKNVFEEAIDHPDNVPAINIAIELSK